jgi:hypothetical protein
MTSHECLDNAFKALRRAALSPDTEIRDSWIAVSKEWAKLASASDGFSRKLPKWAAGVAGLRH